MIPDIIEKRKIFLARTVFRIQASLYDDFFCENSSSSVLTP